MLSFVAIGFTGLLTRERESEPDHVVSTILTSDLGLITEPLTLALLTFFVV